MQFWQPVCGGEDSVYILGIEHNFLKIVLKYIYVQVLVLTPTLCCCVPVGPRSLEFLSSFLQKFTRLPLKFGIWMWAFRGNLNLKIQWTCLPQKASLLQHIWLKRLNNLLRRSSSLAEACQWLIYFSQQGNTWIKLKPHWPNLALVNTVLLQR